VKDSVDLYGLRDLLSQSIYSQRILNPPQYTVTDNSAEQPQGTGTRTTDEVVKTTKSALATSGIYEAGLRSKYAVCRRRHFFDQAKARECDLYCQYDVPWQQWPTPLTQALERLIIEDALPVR
jgi:hypothetical protein